MDRTVNMTAQSILSLTKSTENANLQRDLRNNRKFQELISCYSTGKPIVDKTVYICKLDRDHYLTDGMHSMNAAAAAGYSREFTTKIRNVNTLDEVAEQILTLNKVTNFPATKKFALDLKVKAITGKIGTRLGLFTEVKDETTPGAVTHLTIGQLLQAFMDENPNASKAKTKERVLSASRELINDFIDHMNKLCDIEALVDKKAKVRDICIMIGWAAMGKRNNYTHLVSNTAHNFDKDCTKMTKVHRDVQKKEGWKVIFVQNAR